MIHYFIICSVYFRSEIVINCEGFWKLFELQNHVPEHQLVPEVKEGLYKAFSLAADAFIENDKQKDYYSRVSRFYYRLL